MSDIKLSEDKEMIKIEEREKMLNEENAKDQGFPIIDEDAKAS